MYNMILPWSDLGNKQGVKFQVAISTLKDGGFVKNEAEWTRKAEITKAKFLATVYFTRTALLSCSVPKREQTFICFGVKFQFLLVFVGLRRYNILGFLTADGDTASFFTEIIPGEGVATGWHPTLPPWRWWQVFCLWRRSQTLYMVVAFTSLRGFWRKVRRFIHRMHVFFLSFFL